MRRLLALLLVAAAGPAAAETLIDNANGIQVSADGSLERFTGLLIADDGKVIRTVRRGDPVQPSFTRRIDAGGRTLLPGLIDAHGHVIDAPGGDMGLGLLLLRLDLSGSGSLAEVTSRLAVYVAGNPGSGWIMGRGWNQELWADKRFPSAADIDAVVSDRPVLLARVDGHAAVANSAALKAAGITSATPDPQGGRIARDANGEPTGLLIDNAIPLVSGRAPPPTADIMARGLEAAQEFLFSHGITAVHDVGTSARGWATMNSLGQSGRLKIRIISYVDSLDPTHALPDRPADWLYGDRLRLAGVKLFGDGALGSRGAWLKRPYADMPSSSGLSLLTDAQLRSQANEAAAAGFQVAIHAIGDAANAQAIGVLEEMARQYGAARRWRIEHLQVADPADLPRLKPAGIIASMQPVHQTSDRLMAEARLGPGRLKGAYAWRSILDLGVPLAFGSDLPVESPNPFPGLAAAVSRQDMAGNPPGGWLPEERISFAQALHAFTRGAAHAGFAEQKIGSLSPGRWADFILVDRDPAAADPQALARTQVLETWVAGKRVWHRKTSAGAERGP